MVNDFEVGDRHSIVSATRKDNPGVNQIFMIGHIVGIMDTSNKTAEGILYYEPFDNLEHLWMECGTETFFICFKGEEHVTDNISVHNGYT